MRTCDMDWLLVAAYVVLVVVIAALGYALWRVSE